MGARDVTGFLRRFRAEPRDAEATGSGPGAELEYPAWPEDERELATRDAGLEHRYRVGRLMMVRPPNSPGVIRLARLEPGPERAYAGETIDGRTVRVTEAQLIEPDPERIRRTMSVSSSRPPTSHDSDELVESYAWVSFDGTRVPAHLTNDAAVWTIVKDPSDVRVAPSTSIEVMLAWTDQARLLANDPGSAARRYARVPFVAACRMADGRNLAVDFGLKPNLILPRASVAMFAGFAVRRTG
jgi:hypothetical protein